MDDIYGDLENYNDVNAIDELQKENKELKFKLEGYAAHIETLQKNILQDFDKLSSEFKKLEINYSSLLKTARAEIERKTQIISSLNLERDILYLNSLNDSNKNILNIKRNLTRDRSNSCKKSRKDVSDYGKSNKINFSDQKKHNMEKDRTEESRLPSVDTVSSGHTDETNKFVNIDSNKLGKLESYNDKNCESKENIAKLKTRAQSVRNRRKSMPVLGKQLPKFSSDEENDDNYSTEEMNKKEWHMRDDKNRRVFDRKYDHKSHKISETSGIDEKYSSYHESSRETYYKTKSNKHHDKCKGFKDKYDQQQRYRRHFSPEKHRRAPNRELSDDRYPRKDYGRNRVLESPPVERYETRRNRERRSNYERENPYEERHRHRYDKPTKHKVQSDYDEPVSKRARTDSSNRVNEDDRRSKDIELMVEPIPTIIGGSEHILHTSCQSPDDYMHPDADSTQPVKEIMDTATTNVQLEDPRLTSKKYITKLKNNKSVLSTVVGRHVNLKQIDTSSWNIKHVQIPEALRKPPMYSDELVHLYMNIDPVSNLSMESGEIQYEPNVLGDGISENYLDDRVNEGIQQQSYEQAIPQKKRLEDYETQTEYVKHKNTNATIIERNLLPHTSKISSARNLPDLDSLSDSVSTFSKEIVNKSINDFDQLAVNNNKEEHCIFENSNKFGDIKKQDTRITLTLKDQCSRTSREIVEGDLELSDEASDNVEIQKKIVTETVLQNQGSSKKQIVTKEFNKCEDSFTNIKTADEITDYAASSEEKPKEQIHESCKNKKARRKSQRLRSSSKGSETNIIEMDQITHKKSKSKKDTVTPEIKSKFSDLFGDSSSLITPEDLGIIPQQSTSCTKYVPIFEDALDAIDINAEKPEQIQSKPAESKNINETENIETKTTKTKADDTQNHKTETKSKSKSSKSNKVNDDNKKKKAKKHKEVSNCTVNTKEPINIAETLNCIAVTKEPDVVTTVVISTGVQPQIAQEACKASDVQNIIRENVTLEPERSNIDNIAAIKNVTGYALATSTPCKLPVTNAHNEAESRLQEATNNNTSDSIATRTDISVATDKSSVSNEMNSLNDTDVPDVRIFVKRRKKIVKKAASHT